ncbi:S-layer homology domain-containing protein [Cohnella sp. OV330]|uniref:S-layer homology domain-containing protein n=1 Tax=Cohnella sp. OV330 TaxID=1855288 RepID=UPI000B7D1D3D|nr:S-layer homology domain-containing protein [Cohnella sp. OV330]
MGKRGRKWRGIALAWLLVASMLSGLVLPNIGGGRAAAATAQAAEFGASDLGALAAASASADTAGHWAGDTMAEWQRLGLITGFQDGTLRPDQVISRIEFVALVNRLFAYKGSASLQFADVPDNAWYAPQVQAAVSAGYINGFPDGTFKPNRQLSRAEAAVMLAKLVPAVERDGANALGAFGDRADVPGYARAALGALVEGGIVQGFADGTVRPGGKLTRAEAVVLLDRIRTQSAKGADGGIVPAALRLTAAGTYGPASGTVAVAGDVVIDAPGITLRNVTVRGNLTIGAAVGEGDAYLKGVDVSGSTNLQGGGAHSVHIDDSRLGTVVVEKKDGRIRIVVGGTTVIEQMDVRTDANIESNGSSGAAIEGITISAAGEVSLSGAYSQVEIVGDAKVTVSAGTVERLIVSEKVGTASITLASGVRVADMELHGAASVSGAGIIDKALLDAPGIVFETKPVSIERTDRAGASAGSGGTSGGGTGGGGTPTPTPTPPPASTRVAVAASDAGAGGFRLTLSPAVPGLTASAVSLTDAAGHAVAVVSAATLTNGSAYRVVAALHEGETYTVRLSLSGYEFGAAVTFAVPVVPPEEIAVSAAAADIGTAGLRVTLSPAVAGLNAASFSLRRNGTDEAVAVADAATADGGATYALSAALAEGATYTLTIARAGYRFGSPIAVFVPVTDPGTVSVGASVYEIGASGFKVTFSEPVTGLSASGFTLTKEGGASAAIASATAVDGGLSYVLSAALETGVVYTLAIAKQGYSFGANLQFALQSEADVVVTPTASSVSVNGFLLSLDKTVSGLDALNFELADANGVPVSIDMLSAIAVGKKYEVWARLAKDASYSLTLNKAGYVFDAPAAVKVQPEQVPTTVSDVTHGGFKLHFSRPVYGLASAQLALKDPSGAPVALQSFRLAADARSAAVTANLSASGQYAFRFETDEAQFFEGAVDIADAIPIGKYTTFDGYFGNYTGVSVHFELPVPGLAANAFAITDASGAGVAIDAVVSADGGSTYALSTSGMSAGGPFKLAIAADGYDFGAPATLVSATLNLWGAGHIPTQFMAGLNPQVPNLTKDNFSVKDASGQPVGIVGVTFDSGQRIYVVSFNGTGGQDYQVSVHADGYDFGAPKKIHVYSQSDVSNVTRNGFTLALVPSVLINTAYGFHLRKAADDAPVPIQSVTTVDQGGTYQIQASLAPGAYFLQVDADLDANDFYVSVPLVATLSVDRVTGSGLTAKLSDPVDGLSAGSFSLTDADTGDAVSIASAVTVDQGSSYRLTANLPAGRYNLKLSGHLPEDGVGFEAGDPNDAGASTISNVTTSGFDLAFDNAVPGLLPANLDIRDAQDVKLSGAKLTTNDGGLHYRVSVGLTSGETYTVALEKDNVAFDTPLTMRVKPILKASVTDVSSDGRFTLNFDPAFPEIENYLGLSIADPDGQVYMPNVFESADHGASYAVRVPNQALKPGIGYTIRLDHESYAMAPVSFALPGPYSVTEATAQGLKVRFDTPVGGLGKQNFVVKSATGETFALTSVSTNDGGANYSLVGTLAEGKTYTLQYKPNDLKQSVGPVSFAVTKTVAVTLGSITTAGMKVTFSAKIPDLQFLQLVLSQGGVALPPGSYTLKTTDGGLSYQVAFNGLMPGDDYTLELKREEFKLASAVAFTVPADAVLRFVSANATEIVVGTGVSGMTADNFALYNAKGQKVSVAVSEKEDAPGYYVLKGAFDVTQKYTLKAERTGYTFAPLAVGFKIEVSAFAFGSQAGFKLLLWPGVDGLTPADFAVTDREGNAVAVQSVQTADAGWTYYAKVPLASGKQYQVAIADKPPYVFRFASNQSISLHSNQVAVDRLTLKGFRLVFSSPVYLYNTDVILKDEDGQAVQIRSEISSDGGLSYDLETTLAAGKTYTLSFDKPGYDLGGDIALTVRSVATTFEGMESGNNNAFTLRFDQAVPDLRPSDFTIRRTGQRAPLPVHDATTDDGGYTYRIESSFWGSETVTALPAKSGYDFGDAIQVLVPAIVSPAVLGTGANYVDIGLNPAVMSLGKGDFLVRDASGNPLALTSAVSEDGWKTYRLTGPFVGGETYTILPSKTGYDFGRALTAKLPEAATVRAAAVDASGMTLVLSPGIGGLGEANFALRDGAGHAVAIQSVEALSGGTYKISATLTPGETYKATVSAAGFDFGAPVSAAVPIPVGVSYDGITPQGVTVRMSVPAPGLSAVSFKLTDAVGQAVPISAAASSDGGGTYALKASLPSGSAYSLSIAGAGYDFGAGLPFYVKEPAAASVENPMQTGFALRLDHAVRNLTAGHLSLKDSEGKTVAIGSLTTADGGLTYQAKATLIAGSSYTLVVSSPKADFGSALTFEAQRLIGVTVSDVSSTGFYVQFGEPVASLAPSLVTLMGDDGIVIPLDNNRFYKASADGTRYAVNVTMYAGAVYTLSIAGTNRAFAGPVEFALPKRTSSEVTGATAGGIALALSDPGIELLAADVDLLTADGDAVRVTGVVPGTTAGTYVVQAALAEGSTYSLRIVKFKYDFGAASSVYVPYRVSVRIAKLHEGGLTIALSMPVQGLAAKLIDASGRDAVGTLTTTDDGLTYTIAANVSYNQAFTLKLSKTGYDFGADLPVNNVSAPPQLVSAATSADGKLITLYFDKQLALTDERSVFSVKIDSQWQSGVLSTLGADKTQIVLTWTGKVIGESSKVSVASSGVNRVYAVNKTYMAPFEEVAVSNVSSLLGMIQSYANAGDAASPAQVLHAQYGKTPLETAIALREGGFKNAVLYAAVVREYLLDRTDLAPLLYAMNADAKAICDAYAKYNVAASFNGMDMIGQLISAGFTAAEIGPALQALGFSSKVAAVYLKKAGVSGEAAAQVLRSDYKETSAGAASLLRTANYAKNDIGAAIRRVYATAAADTVQALADGGLSASEIAAAVLSVYGTEAVDNAELLSRAGFEPSAIGDAIAQLYDYDSLSEAADVFLGAGFSASDAYGILSKEYGRELVAAELLGKGNTATEVGAGIRSAGAGAGVLIDAMKRIGDDDAAIAAAVNDVWVSTGTALSAILIEFAANGYTIERRSALAREYFGADIAAAVSALSPALDYAQRNSMIKYILAGGYDPAQTASYFMNNGMHPYETFRKLTLAGLSADKALGAMRDAVLQSGGPFGLNEAIQYIANDYNRRYTAAEAVAALRTVFAQAADVQTDAVSIATAASPYWDKLDISKALVGQMGLTLRDFLDLERTSAFARFGCPCAVPTAVNDAQYMFSNLTIQDMNGAMSTSGLYDLADVIDGNFYLNNIWYSRDKSAAAPYVMSALKNTGYAFEEVAAEFDRLNIANWIAAFSKNGIAASDVAAYLKSQSESMEQVIDRLAPYPLKDKALVLRDAYGIDAPAAAAVLTAHTNDDDEAIGRAIAWAYGGDPVALWIQTLRAQGGTATSVMNTIFARYPSYRDASLIGPALMRAGFDQADVLQGMVTVAYRYSGVVQLKDTIRVLQSLYSQQQVTISQLLKAASLDTPESGLAFLAYAGYSMADIAGSLKNDYGLTAAEAAALLAKQYPNDKKKILTGLAGLYGQTLAATMTETLEAAGITSAEGAIDYLRYEGFGIQELAGLMKDRYSWSAGKTAAAFVQRNMGANNALVTAISAAYGLSVEKVIHALLAEQGTATYAGAVPFVYQAQFSLATNVKVAKDGYGVSAGEAMKALLGTSYYQQSDVVAVVAQVYGTSQTANIVDSLAANHMDTLGSAVTFLGRMGFGLENIVRVGMEHYELTAGETAAELDGYYTTDEIQQAVSYVYGQTLTETMLDTLAATGKPEFADAIPDLLQSQFALSDIVLAAKAYYHLSAGEASYALLQSKLFASANVLATVAEYYGKPIAQSADELLDESGIAGIAEAALLLRSMGYSLQDVVEISKRYYGNTAAATTEALAALGFEDEAVVDWTVQYVYEGTSDSSASSGPQEALQEAGITGAGESVAYLWSAGYSLFDIVKFLKTFHGKSSAESAELLLGGGTLDVAAILSALNGVYGSTYDAATIDAFKRLGAFDSSDKAARLLSAAGYRMTAIAETMRSSYGLTFAQTQATLSSLGAYAATAIQTTVDQVYATVGASSGTLQQVLDLYGIRTQEGAVAFLRRQETPVADIVQYLKDAYDLGADEATALLVTYYPGTDLGLAISKVYYSSESIGYLAKILPDNATTPSSVVSFMKGSFSDAQIVLALKVLFHLDALGVIDAISPAVLSAERVRAAVAEVYGDDPLFAYLKRMKDRGANANDVSAELALRGLLDTAPASYLVDTLMKLGYDNASILKMRYNYFNVTRGNEGTEAEQGAQFAQLGVTSPAAIVQTLRNWTMLPYKVIYIVRAANPSASLTDIAFAMRGQNIAATDIMGAVSAVGDKPSSLSASFKALGLTAQQAMSNASDLAYAVRLQMLIDNGYALTDYFRNLDITGSNGPVTVQLLIASGVSASTLAKMMVSYRNMGFYSIAKALYDGGVTKIEDVAEALLAANCRPAWIIYYMQEIGDWTVKQIAQELHDADVISLVDLVAAIQYATGDRLNITYAIIKEISGSERQAFYNALDPAARSLVNNGEISMIVTITTLRYAGIDVSEAAGQLLNTEREYDLGTATKVMVLSGYNVLDVAETMIDVYRAILTFEITKIMFKKLAETAIPNFPDYYRIAKRLYQIVNFTIRVVDYTT